MMLTGEYTLTIYGDSIDFVEIEELLGLHASKMVKKGQKIITNKIAPTSIWSYTKRVKEDCLYEEGLRDFLCEIYEKKEIISKLSSEYNVEINCYLRSEYGQFGYELNRDIINLLNKLDLPVSFHILSLGQA